MLPGMTVAMLRKCKYHNHPRRCGLIFNRLHHEVAAFVHYMSPSQEEHEIRGLVVALVSKAVTNAFPDARIIPFGSYETKLYLPNG